MNKPTMTALIVASTFALSLPAVAKSKRMQNSDNEALESALTSATPTGEGTGGSMKLATRAGDLIRDGVFTDDERQKIRDYYRNRRQENEQNAPEVKDDDKGKSKGKKEKGNKEKGKGKSNTMPPGLAKKDELPPGLQMQLEKNGKLPPGLEKRDLPGDLNENLPRREGRFRRILVDNDVALIDEEQGIVLDIIEGVVGGD